MKSQTFGEKIRTLRKEKQYSLKYVSDKIGYNEKSLSLVEQNRLRAPQRIIEPLAELYNVIYKDLMVKYLSEVVYYETKQFDFANEVLEIVQKRLRKEKHGTRKELDKSEILQSISTYFNSKPVEKVWLFGSFARDNQVSFDSDIDILVEFRKPNKITLFDLIEMKADLSEKTGREIDLVEKGQELQSMKNSIEQDKILVYAA